MGEPSRRLRRRQGGRYWVLTESQDRTWRYLRTRAKGPDQTVAASLVEIARATGITKRTAIEHIRRLIQLGRIRVVQEGGGRGRKTVYRAPKDFRHRSWDAWVRKRVKPFSPPSHLLLSRAESVPQESSPHAAARLDDGISSLEKALRSLEAQHPPLRVPPNRLFFRLTERELVDREARDRTYRRLVAAGVILEPSERRREQWHGLFYRASRKAVNVLAFMAGVVRGGLWRVVGECDREAARWDIRALDGLLDTHRRSSAAPAPRRGGPCGTVKLYQFEGGAEPTRTYRAAELLDRVVGPLLDLGTWAPSCPSAQPSEETMNEREGQVLDAIARGMTHDEAESYLDAGRILYGLVVHDWVPLNRAIERVRQMGGVPTGVDLREWGIRFATAQGTLEQWRRAAARTEDGDNIPNGFTAWREQRAQSRAKKADLDSMLKGVYGEKK